MSRELSALKHRINNPALKSDRENVEAALQAEVQNALGLRKRAEQRVERLKSEVEELKTALLLHRLPAAGPQRVFLAMVGSSHRCRSHIVSFGCPALARRR